jgi:hypothetical protein
LDKPGDDRSPFLQELVVFGTVVVEQFSLEQWPANVGHYHHANKVGKKMRKSNGSNVAGCHFFIDPLFNLAEIQSLV